MNADLTARETAKQSGTISDLFAAPTSRNSWDKLPELATAPNHSSREFQHELRMGAPKIFSDSRNDWQKTPTEILVNRISSKLLQPSLNNAFEQNNLGTLTKEFDMGKEACFNGKGGAYLADPKSYLKNEMLPKQAERVGSKLVIRELPSSLAANRELPSFSVFYDIRTGQKITTNEDSGNFIFNI